MAEFTVHFDGPITVEHKLSIRVLGNTYEHMQRSIDRAYLINKYGHVRKHQRLSALDYENTEFLGEYPVEGGIILTAFKDGAERIIDRVHAAILPIFENAVSDTFQQHESISAQLGQRKEYVHGMGHNTRSFESVQADPPPNWASGYSNRSVIKEIDQLVGQITPERVESSTVDITLIGSRPHLPLVFDEWIARNFHVIASQRDLGPPMSVRASIRSLDRGNRTTRPNAKILNIDSGKEVSLHLSNLSDVDELHPYHNGGEVVLYVSPIIEALGFDMIGGDLHYLAIA